MEFVEYEKMALSLDPFKDAFKSLDKEEWVVLEKVHGANFSCHTNGEECKFARRRDFLKENEGFYNYKKADFMKAFGEKAKHIFKRVQELLVGKEVAQVIIYGEVFGGKHFHLKYAVLHHKLTGWLAEDCILNTMLSHIIIKTLFASYHEL